MEIAEYKNIFENESSHFFYVANNKLFLQLAKKYCTGKKKNAQILDAGCGTGMFAKKLAVLGQVVGIDLSSHALAFARKRGVRVKKASVTKLPFRSNSFDLVTSIDVLYHRAVNNERVALEEFLRVLKPGGVGIIRVPAHKWLALSHDTFVHTRKRFEKKEFERLLINTGFLVEKLTFVNVVVYPLAIFRHFFEKLFRSKPNTSGLTILPPFINTLLLMLTNIEHSLVNMVNLPVGLGLLAVCKKPILRKLSSLSVVFPAYNDARSIPLIVKKMSRILPQVAKKYEIIVVNDGSKDNSDEVFLSLQKITRFLTIVSHKKNLGYGASLRTGFKKAKMDFIFYTDGDGQYDVSELKKLVAHMDDATDMVSGYKMSRSDPWFRKFLGLVYNQFIRLTFGLRVRDVDCDFRLFRKNILRGVRFFVTSGAFDAEFMKTLHHKRVRIQEVPIHHYPRLHGSSQFFNPFSLLRSFLDLTKLVYSSTFR